MVIYLGLARDGAFEGVKVEDGGCDTVVRATDEGDVEVEEGEKEGGGEKEGEGEIGGVVGLAVDTEFRREKVPGLAGKGEVG